RLAWAVPVTVALLISFAPSAEEHSFDNVKKILQDRCLDCHSAPDPDGSFLMESHDALMKGGESGPALVPGNSEGSLLVRMIEGKFERNGKRIVMPPGKREKLSTAEIALIRAWIDAGATATGDAVVAKEIVVPTITPTVPPKRSIY